MSPFRAYLRLVYWDWLREMKRKDTLLSMLLFSMVTLFVFSRAIDPSTAAAVDARSGILWTTLLMAGAIGIDRAFRVEGGARVIEGLLLSSVGRPTIYYAKVTSTFLYLLVMESVVLIAFILLYNVEVGVRELAALLLLFAAVTLGFVAVGITLSAMTHALHGGDVLLRILLFALLIPVFWAAVEATNGVLSKRVWEAGPTWLILCFDLVYLGAGHLVIGPVLRDYEGD